MRTAPLGNTSADATCVPEIAHCCSKKRLLTSMTSICACAAFGLLSIAVSTDYWLFTVEKVKREGNTTATDDGIVYETVYSGLWRKCMIEGELDQT